MKCKHCEDSDIEAGSNYCPTCGSNLTGHCITDKLLAQEASKAHVLLNNLGIANVDSGRKGRFLPLIERIELLRARCNLNKMNLRLSPSLIAATLSAVATISGQELCVDANGTRLSSCYLLNTRELSHEETGIALGERGLCLKSSPGVIEPNRKNKARRASLSQDCASTNKQGFSFLTTPMDDTGLPRQANVCEENENNLSRLGVEGSLPSPCSSQGTGNTLTKTMDLGVSQGEGRDPGLNAPTGYSLSTKQERSGDEKCRLNIQEPEASPAKHAGTSTSLERNVETKSDFHQVASNAAPTVQTTSAACPKSVATPSLSRENQTLKVSVAEKYADLIAESGKWYEPTAKDLHP